MQTLADRLKRARIAAGYGSATEAAEKFDWNANTYRSIENGNRQPSSSNAIEFAEAFEIRVDWLLTGRGPMREGQQRHVPVFQLRDLPTTQRNHHAVRSFRHLAKARGFIAVPEVWNVSRRTFAVEIIESNDSMVEQPTTARSLYPGDTIIVDRQAELHPGCIVVAIAAVADQLTAVVRELKLTPKPNVFTLSAFNDAYPDVTIPRKSIIGVMVGLFRRPARRR